jgi:hypothetical protein
MKTTIPRNSNLSLLLTLLVLTYFALSPAARAVSPVPDGGYGGQNTAEGTDALFDLTTGAWNSACGFRALYKNATSNRNTAVGYKALYNTNGQYNVSGQQNVAVGANALFSNTTGSRNIAIGALALFDNTTGSNNIAIGDHALWHFTGSGNTQIGDSFSSSPDSVLIGREPGPYDGCSAVDFGTPYAYVYGYQNVSIGVNFGGCPEVKTLRVHLVAQDAVYVDAVNDNPIAGSPVSINSFGQLGVATSSKRFKTDIKPMEKASEAVLALKPVTFRYNTKIDRNSTPQFGLVAEEVEKVNPDLVSRDEKGNAYTVRYDAVNAMLLNEFLKEHRKVEQLKKDFESRLAQQQKQIDALTAGLQKVSAELEASKPAPQVVKNP